jgi:antitoxin (DNA-binding transcriptional repressor) of toxin-antitoxin stability system
MKTMTVGEFKAQFSAVLEQIKQGETVVICHGRRREKIAALVPYRQISRHNRPLGLLQGRASCVIHEDFELGEEEFLKT